MHMEQQQLPPKPPIHNWSSSSFPFQMMHPPPTSSATAWVDEFLDFSSTRRNAHRRTVSDPIAFVEETASQQQQQQHGFDRLNDEQLRNMFSDDVGPASNPSSTNPSTPSDQNDNSDHEDDKSPVERHGVRLKDEEGEVDVNKFSESGDTAIHDPKRIKRILANRQSAQRSRVRKLQYISELERSVTNLQTEVSTLSPRVAYLDHQRLLLNVDNSALKQRIAALAQDQIFKDAHQEALKKEIERLRKVYHEQNIKKTAANAPPSPAEETTFKKMGCTAEE